MTSQRFSMWGRARPARSAVALGWNWFLPWRMYDRSGWPVIRGSH